MYNYDLLLIDLIAVVYLSILAVNAIRNFISDGKMIHIIYILFYVMYAYPLIFLMFSWGYEYDYFVQYNSSMTDYPTRIITNALVCLFAYFLTRKDKKKPPSNLITCENAKINNIFFKLVLLVFIFFPVAYVIIKGKLSQFIVYGAISQSDRLGDISDIYTVVFNWSMISLFCSGLYLSASKNIYWYERLILICNIALVSLINGKRYILVFAAIIFFLVSYINKKITAKAFIRRGLVLSVVLVAFSFLYLTFIKSQGYTEVSLFESLYIDLSRYDRLASVVYSKLYPDQYAILEYPMQTVLYNLFFFIPRSIWPSKPYPYQYTYSYSVHFPTDSAYTYDFVAKNWEFRGISGITTNFFDEILCNAGFIFGIILIGLIISLMKKYLDYFHDTLKYITTFLAIYMMVFSVDPQIVLGILLFAFVYYQTRIKHRDRIVLRGR